MYGPASMGPSLVTTVDGAERDFASPRRQCFNGAVVGYDGRCRRAMAESLASRRFNGAVVGYDGRYLLSLRRFLLDS